MHMSAIDKQNTVSRRSFVAAAAGSAALAAAGSHLASAAEAAASKLTDADAAASGLDGAADGSYTAEAEGVGTVTATITVKGGVITAADIDVSGETSFVGGVLKDVLGQAFIDAQDWQIDVISGATMTCKGAMNAVKACLAQAQGTQPEEAFTWDDQSADNWLGTEPSIPDSLITEDVNTDIVIVGAGNAGMAAALYAAQNNLDFRVVESGSSVQETRHWFGAIDSAAAKAAGADPVDRKMLLSEISRYAEGRCNQSVVKMWIEESADLYDFVASYMESAPYNYSCKFTAGETAHWPEECSEHNTVYFFPEQEHTYIGAEKSRNVVFEECLERLGHSIDFNTSLVKLLTSDSKVTGIIAQNVDDGHFVRYNASRGVLLCCGGYDGNPLMLQALDPSSVEVTTCTNASPRDRGMGIRAAVWAGARLDPCPATMLFDRGLVGNGVDAGLAKNSKAFGGLEFPGTLKQYNTGTQPFLKVNRRGERFANESSPYNDILYAAGNQPGGVYAQICDANFYEDILRFATIGCSAGAQVEGRAQSLFDRYEEEGLIQKADTLEELADKMGFTDEAKETFLATCERYNGLYDAGEDTDFGKPAVRLSELRTAPFYGAWLGGSILCTMQGISINGNAQALSAQDREPIEGLYVAGNNAGSMFAANYPCLLPGLRCGSAMVQGIKAIKVMAGLQ